MPTSPRRSQLTTDVGPPQVTGPPLGFREPVPAPALPIILFSVLAGLGASVLVFYALYAMLQIPLPWSAGLSVLALIGTVSGVAGGLGALYDRRTVGVHIGFSCTLTALVLAFAGLCMVVGMLAGALALLFGQP